MAGLWHVSFAVSDLGRSLAFYRDQLGVDVVHTQDQANECTRRLVGYADAHLRVAMMWIPGAPVGTPPGTGGVRGSRGEHADVATKNPGSGHLAFIVRDIQGAYRRPKDAGVVFRSEPVAITEGRNGGGYTVYFLDPDGTTLELVQPPPQFWEATAS